MKAGIDVSRLRHPHELPIFAGAVLLNSIACVGAILFVIRGGEWLLSSFPFLDTYATEIHAIAVAAVLAPPLLVFTRNRRLARIRGDSVKVSPTQFPLIHERYVAQCGRLGVSEPPTLYVSDGAIDEPGHAYASWGREFIVLGTDFLEADLARLQDCWSFLTARELGRHALGHVHWWNQLLLSYVERLPWVLRPLRHARAYSLDHVAAFLEPEGVRGLIIQQAGRRSLPSTNVAEQIRYARSVGGFWVRVSNVGDGRAHLAARIRNLYDRGYFDLDHDLRRFEGESLD